MRIQQIKKIITIISAVLILSSCASNEPINTAQVSYIGNKHYNKDIKVSNLHSARSGILYKAGATITNTKNDETLQVYYRCVFLDEDQFTIGDDRQWIPLLVYANQAKDIKCSLANSKVENFKIEIDSAGEANQIQ